MRGLYTRAHESVTPGKGEFCGRNRVKRLCVGYLHWSGRPVGVGYGRWTGNFSRDTIVSVAIALGALEKIGVCLVRALFVVAMHPCGLLDRTGQACFFSTMEP